MYKTLTFASPLKKKSKKLSSHEIITTNPIKFSIDILSNPRICTQQNLIVHRKQQIQLDRWKQVSKSLGAVQDKLFNKKYQYHCSMINKNKGNSLHYANAILEMSSYLSQSQQRRKDSSKKQMKLTKLDKKHRDWKINQQKSLVYRVQPFWMRIKPSKAHTNFRIKRKYAKY